MRAELEAKPLGQVSEDGSNNAGLNELQKRLERKADIDVVEQLIRASTNTKDVKTKLHKSNYYGIIE